MGKIIPLKQKPNIPIYGECGCGGDTFLLHLSSDDIEDAGVIALECATCRESVELEPSIVITLEMDNGSDPEIQAT